MESSLMMVLQISVKRMKELNVIVTDLLTEFNNSSRSHEILQRIEVNSSKLENAINKVQAEINKYFQYVNDPDSDEICEISSAQLEAEELLCETRILLKDMKSSNGKEEKVVTGRLPKLNLPEFEGDILYWTQFWDQFSSNIDDRNIADVDKLLYLKGALKGQASQVVEGLESTNANYKIAVSTLTERYGRPTKVIDAHYSALNKISPAQNSVIDYRRVLNDIERHLRVLSSLGEDTSHGHLRFLISEKFPEDLIYEMKMKIKDDSIEEMRKQLEAIISAREDANRISQINPTRDNYTIETFHVKDRHAPSSSNYNRQHSSYNSNNKPSHFQNSKSQKRHNEFRTTNSKVFGNKRRKLQCIFCENPHFNDKCNLVKTLTERKLKLSDKCHICFRRGHHKNECDYKYTCYHCKKSGIHNRALCPLLFVKEDETTSTFSTNNNSPTSVLQTAIANVRKDGSATYLNCRILMDSGSQRSYVTQRIAQKLDLPTEERNHLSVFTFGATVPQLFDSALVKIKLKSKRGEELTIFANVVPTISDNVPYFNLERIEDKSVLADDGSLHNNIDILIGIDYYYTLMSTEKIEIKPNLFLVNSKLGWILSGQVNPQPMNELSVNTYFQSGLEVKLDKPDLPLDTGNVKCLWELESIGITDSPKANRDEEAIKNFNETTKFVDNRYSVCWPWNDYPPSLPSNFGLAFGRLVNLLKRLDRETLSAYDGILQEQLGKGIIEVVPSDYRKNSDDHPVHYLPHHSVAQPGKSIRLVYDASSKTKDNKSLNECLYRGPLMIQDLTALIMRFRTHKIALCADVEKAFLQISLQDRDRDVTRFLWLKDTSKPPSEDNLLHLRFCRVPFGVISSPFLLNATIKHHLQRSEKENVRQVADDIYVDNMVTGSDNVQSAITLYQDTQGTFKQISMNLRDWSSNSKELMQKIPDACKENNVKILGLDWSLDGDNLKLRFKNDCHPRTKRGVLKTVASIYDPCGYAVPHVLPAKLFLQDLWKTKWKWDTPLPEEIYDKWAEITNDLNDIKDISLPRQFTKNTITHDYQLHCFADASTKAYAAVVYIVSGKDKGFVIGKSRLVPIKDQENLKIPRLELLGVLIGSRLLKYVLNSIKVNVSYAYLWTDSRIVIDWYNSDKLLTPFVARRIEEIKKNRDLSIRYVPSELNPADIATRPIVSKEKKEHWLRGPDFIVEEPNKWPTHSASVNTLSAAEVLSMTESLDDLNEDSANAENLREDSANDVLPSIMSKEHCDAGSDKNEKDSKESSLARIKESQEEYFPDETKGKVTSLSRNLDLFKDIDGILRSKGRMKNADWSFDKRYPVLLPKDCELTREIIMQTHEKNYHVGSNHTLSIIRENYWIPHGKSQVQKVLKKCPRCIKHGGGPYKLPPTPALPTERVNYSAPFTFTGVDYIGPVMVNDGKGTSKRWICLFTCLAVRAIHLEIVQDLTAEEGLLALRRMIAARGVPNLITSDNASHFKLMSEVLSQPYCVENKIKWKFIPALTPWFGGFYERLVSLVKHCMKRTIGKHLLKDPELLTVVKEIEAVLNSRPLVCVDTEIEHVLKPADFLTMGKCITLDTASDQSLVSGTTTKMDLVKGWRRALTILEEFKRMFSSRYLPSLRERYWHSHKEPRLTSKITPKEGQIVQLKGDSSNREKWQVGKLIKLIKGSDGLARVAKVQVGNTEYIRSLAHLYPLEIEETEDEKQHSTIRTVDSERTYEIENEGDETDGQVSPNKTTDLPHNDDDSHKELLYSVDNTKEDESMEILVSRDELDTKERTFEMHKERGNNNCTKLRPRRSAATKALEKMKEWSHNLSSLF